MLYADTLIVTGLNVSSIGLSWIIQTSLWKNTSDSKKKKLKDKVEHLIGKLPDLIFLTDMAPLPHHDLRHPWLRYQVEGYDEAGSESRTPMLNKENYVPWSSRLLRYAKSRPNGKLIHNSILNGPYVKKMIPEPRDANHEITVTETFHLQTDDELSDKELKQIKADDQAIQTILLENFIKPKEQNARNLAMYNDVIRNQVIQNAVKNPRVQNVGNQNGLIGVQGNGNQNQIGNGNLVAARAEGNAAGQNENQIRCYNCRRVGHYARNYTVRPRRMDVAYLQTQLLIAQKEEA
nr:hypothetical protein [Tanacetum cinerariifolium]